MNRLRATIERALDDLRVLEEPWAVVGGFAVSSHAEPRTTRDLDVALAVSNDDHAERIVRSFLRQGYVVVAAVERTDRPRLATVRLRPPIEDAAIVDLLFDSSGIESEIAAAASSMEILPGVFAPVATVGHLIAMKVLARDDRSRPQDWDDLKNLVAEAEEVELSRARESLELIGRRGYARDKALIDELDALQREFTSTPAPR